MGMDGYAEYDALGLAALVRSGEVKPSELVEAAIERIERHNPSLNAVVFEAFDEGRERARRLDKAKDGGVFRGVPFLLKDIFAAHEGWPNASGSRLLSGYRAPYDATLTARYKQAGMVPLGKTNAPEFGILPTTEPALYGPARNPWNTDHSTGGSSGGSAAMVAAGALPFAHANDGGGSIRIPASCCGLVGMKPTRARNPLGPDIGDLMNGLVCEHVVSRSVRDSAAALDCTAGPEPGDPYWAPPLARPLLQEVEADPGRLRIAFRREHLDGRPLDPACVEAIESAARLCEELGHSVEEASPEIERETVNEAFMAVWAAGLAAGVDMAAMAMGREPGPDDLEPLTRGLYERGRQVGASQYLLAVGALQQAARQIARFHEHYDIWLTSTLGAPPVRNGVIDINEPDPDKGFEPILDYVPFTPIQNATGQPAVSLPLHWTGEGLPVGVMFSGRFGDEATLYRLSGQLERARPWRDRRPPVWG